MFFFVESSIQYSKHASVDIALVCTEVAAFLCVSEEMAFLVCVCRTSHGHVYKAADEKVKGWEWVISDTGVVRESHWTMTVELRPENMPATQRGKVKAEDRDLTLLEKETARQCC